jgi:hypothetical protein
VARRGKKKPHPKDRATHTWPRHPDDWYVEEHWVSSRFFELTKVTGPVLDPACGFGRVVRSALEAGISARGSDIKPRWQLAPRVGDGHRASHEKFYAVCDFLNGHWPPKRGIWSDPATVMTNVPFRRVLPFYEAAIARAETVIFLLPFTWQCGAGISAWLETTPLARVYPIGPRASMPPGDYLLAGHKPQGGRADHAWFEWRNGVKPVARGGRRPEIIGLRREAGAAS